MRALMLTLALLLFAAPSLARIEAYQFDNPGDEARYQRLVEELRCLVCQNQNLADSNAELAQDMRRLTYEMVRKGSTDEEIVTFMVDRYGDFVLYRPPLKKSTLFLWAGPFVILGGGLVVLLMFVRGRGRQQPAELTPEDQLRAEQLLGQSEKENR